MACNVCTKNFSWLRKEYGCPQCKYAFCSGCLNKTIEVPKCRGEKRKVCPSCYEKLSRDKLVGEIEAKEEETFSKLEGELLDTPVPEIPAIQLQPNAASGASAMPVAPSNLAEEDRVIAERLAKLKGTEHKNYDHRELLTKVEKRSNAARIQDLLTQFMDEKALREKTDEAVGTTTEDIARRLAKLKDENYEDTKAAISRIAEAGDDDSCMSIDNIVKKYMITVTLPATEDENELAPPPGNKRSDPGEEYLPWCVICSEDADIVCDSCDGDHYCESCFSECHDEDEYRSHRKRPFKHSNQSSTATG